MSFSRYEVRIDDESLAVVWGPHHSLARARAVAQETAREQRVNVRLDVLIFVRIGEPFPEGDPLEFHAPPSGTPAHARARQALAAWRDPSQGRHGVVVDGTAEVRFVHNRASGRREWIVDFSREPAEFDVRHWLAPLDD